MGELIAMRDLTLNLLFILFFFGLLIQCLLFFLAVTGSQSDKGTIVYEALLLCWLAWVSWYIGVLKDNLFNGIILLPGGDLRFCVLPAVILGLWLWVRTRQLRFGLSSLLLLMLLPVFDSLIAGIFGLRLLALSSLLILLSLLEFAKQMPEMQTNMTSLSIKEALDQLPDGLLFAGKSGQPVSINQRAQEMISSLGLSAYDRICILWDSLSHHPDRVPDTDGPDGVLIRPEAGGCLSVQKYPIQVGRRRFTQLYLRDVTGEFRVAEQIENENARLEKNAQELKRLLELAEDNARRKEVLDSRARLHDVLSQRLSLTRVLLGGLGNTPDERQLNEIKELLINIKQDLFYEPELTPRMQLDQLLSIYRTIGTDIICWGQLPASEEISNVFVKILREAFSNAIRHAGAAHILVHFEEHGSSYRMSVSNDGYFQSDFPKEGNGIKNMRARLEPLGGSLSIKTGGKFTVQISVAKYGKESGRLSSEK